MGEKANCYVEANWVRKSIGAETILLIQRGFKDQTYGMPLVALCANLSWEFIFSFIHPHQPPQIQINFVWLMLDLIILYEFFKFGQSELKHIPNKLFYPVFILTLFTSFC
ncbi:MAG: hypothetical protein HWQ38_19190 [Nostoc sp. NMS7]|uniref:transmembrane-type terpene cyclase n=1 Tax=Nostoc sp. NMS7 TaxID=2815391 RepID=UPI0025E32C7E|nr:hypothetical protein [Nostoc sp. NMS7]MBN3948462.1 hypothetical protein [Nostoc sp. NMS7]